MAIVFVLQGVGITNVSDDALRRAQGLSIRFDWQAVANGDWRYVDSQVMRARRAGKPYMLRMIGGTAGTTPPWNTNAKENFARIVFEMGQRYGGDPLLYAVHLSSTANDESAEMHLANWVLNHRSYSDQRIIDAWTYAIDAYAVAFPTKRLILNLSIEPDSRGGVTWPVVAYCKARLGVRAGFQHNSLKASTSPTAKHHQAIVAQSRDGYVTGYQMACPSSNRDRFGGTFAEAIAKGEAAGAQYFEVYQGDL
jgi:hypothetical protein